MLIDFSIQNYLSIRDKQTLSFVADKSISHLDEYYVENVGGLRLLKIGLIMGANASGKSNIIKALDYMRELVIHPKQSKNQATDCTPFLLDDTSSKENTIFEINFVQKGSTYYYRIELNNECIVAETLKTSFTGRTIFNRQTDTDKKLSYIKFGSEYPIKKDNLNALASNTLWNNTVIGGFLKTNIENQELANVQEWFSTYLHRLIMPREDLTAYISHKIHTGCIDKNALLPIMRQADFNISDIVVKKENADYDVRFGHDGASQCLTPIPYALESLGTQRYYALAGLLYLLIKSHNCYMIDELDDSLHPDLYIHFLLSYCVNAHGSQLIATTHNREILNNKDLFRNDMISIADRNSASTTELYRLSDFDTSVIRDTSNILNAYKAGRLGGVPNLGDYYITLPDHEA